MEYAALIAPESAGKRGKLAAAFVRTVNRPGVYGDEQGLWLRVYESRKRKSNSKHWIWRGPLTAGSATQVSAASPTSRWPRAWQTAFEYRKIARAGGDPLTLRRRLDAPTFAEAAETVIAIHREGWKNAGKIFLHFDFDQQVLGQLRRAVGRHAHAEAKFIVASSPRRLNWSSVCAVT